MTSRGRKGSVAMSSVDFPLPPPPPPPSTLPPPTDHSNGNIATNSDNINAIDVHNTSNAYSRSTTINSNPNSENDNGNNHVNNNNNKVDVDRLVADIESLLNDPHSLPNEHHPIDKCGWLTKEGRVVKNWKRRWFVLSGVHLSYYEDHLSTKHKPKGSMRLDTAKIQPINSLKMPHTISVVSEGRKLLLQADNGDVCSSWVLELNRKVACLDYVKKCRMMGGHPDPRVMRFFVDRDRSKLDMSGMPVALEAFVAMDHPMRYHTTLTSISMDGCALSDLEVQVLSGALAENGTVTELSLARNAISEDGASAIAMALERGSTVKSIVLDDNSIGDRGCSAIASAVSSKRPFVRLSLRRNGISCSGADDIAKALVAQRALGLKNGPGEDPVMIESVELSGNSIADDGAESIARAIADGKTVTSVDLDGNAVEDAGAEAFANALTSEGCALEELIIADNLIGARGAICLARSLARCKSLTMFDIGGNDIRSEGLKALAAADSSFAFVELEVDVKI